LRARKFVLKETEKMWFDFIKWRKEMDLDNYKVHFSKLRISICPTFMNSEKYIPMDTTSTTSK